MTYEYFHNIHFKFFSTELCSYTINMYLELYNLKNVTNFFFSTFLNLHFLKIVLNSLDMECTFTFSLNTFLTNHHQTKGAKITWKTNPPTQLPCDF